MRTVTVVRAGTPCRCNHPLPQLTQGSSGGTRPPSRDPQHPEGRAAERVPLATSRRFLLHQAPIRRGETPPRPFHSPGAWSQDLGGVEPLQSSQGNALSRWEVGPPHRVAVTLPPSPQCEQRQPRSSPRPSLCCSWRAVSARALPLISSSWARGARPRSTTICTHRGKTCFIPAFWEPEGGRGSCWGREAGGGPHRPRVASLPQCLASSSLGGQHGVENAAIGAGGLDGPLDEAVLVEPAEDAASKQERATGCVGWGPGPRHPQTNRPASSGAPVPSTCPAARPPCAPFSSLAAGLGRDPSGDLVQTTAASSRSPPRWAVPQEGPVAPPGRPAATHLDRLRASWASRWACVSAASTKPTLLPAGEKARICSSSGVWAPSRFAARCSYSWKGRGCKWDPPPLNPVRYSLCRDLGTRRPRSARRPLAASESPGSTALTSLAWSMPCRSPESWARVSLAACRVALSVALSLDSSCFRS
uniref:Uncharacterized protein n=1 Tax=Mustela putorius furo TaxID=9669 RepID=M3Z8X6_MUSPF